MSGTPTNKGEKGQMPEVPLNSFDFTKVFRQSPEIIENVYPGLPIEINPKLPMILLLIGGSNVGKDLAMNPLIEKGFLSHAVTGTSREMRTSGPRVEKGHEYIWFDRPTPEEVEEIKQLEKLPHEERTEDKLPGYVKRMIGKFELVEWDVHHGSLYGLPKGSLDLAIQDGGIPVIRTESYGALTIQRNLKGKYNVVIVGVIPDSYKQIWERLVSDSGLSDEMKHKRFVDSIEINNMLPHLVHFFLHNSVNNSDIDGVDGREVTPRSLERLLKILLSEENITW